MAATRVRNMWTALLSALVALFAALGFAGQASATQAQVPHTTQAKAAEQEAPATAPAAAWSPRLPAGSALPPTMKQRIGAEAHGSSPATRSLTRDATEADPLTPP